MKGLSSHTALHLHLDHHHLRAVAVDFVESKSVFCMFFATEKQLKSQLLVACVFFGRHGHFVGQLLEVEIIGLNVQSPLGRKLN